MIIEKNVIHCILLLPVFLLPLAFVGSYLLFAISQLPGHSENLSTPCPITPILRVCCGTSKLLHLWWPTLGVKKLSRESRLLERDLFQLTEALGPTVTPKSKEFTLSNVGLKEFWSEKKKKIDAFVKCRDPWIRGHLLLHFKNISFFPVNGTKVFQIVDTGSMICVFVCVYLCVCMKFLLKMYLVSQVQVLYFAHKWNHHLQSALDPNSFEDLCPKAKKTQVFLRASILIFMCKI